MPRLTLDPIEYRDREAEAEAKEREQFAERVHCDPARKPAAAPSEEDKAYQLFARWRDRAETFGQQADECAKKAQHAEYLARYFPVESDIDALAAVLWRKQAAELIAHRDNCRRLAAEANLAWAALSGQSPWTLDWEG